MRYAPTVLIVILFVAVVSLFFYVASHPAKWEVESVTVVDEGGERTLRVVFAKDYDLFVDKAHVNIHRHGNDFHVEGMHKPYKNEVERAINALIEEYFSVSVLEGRSGAAEVQ